MKTNSKPNYPLQTIDSHEPDSILILEHRVLLLISCFLSLSVYCFIKFYKYNGTKRYFYTTTMFLFVGVVVVVNQIMFFYSNLVSNERGSPRVAAGVSC